jgi:hypothetical protein
MEQRTEEMNFVMKPLEVTTSIDLVPASKTVLLLE